MSEVYITIDPEPVAAHTPMLVEREEDVCCLCECCACVGYMIHGTLVLLFGNGTQTQ